MRKRPYFDSNAFIELLEGSDELSVPLQALLLRLRTENITIVASELVLAEVLVKARMRGGPQLHKKYIDLLVFSGAVELQAITRNLLYSVARYREATGARIPDAIHVVTAIQCGCPVILTRDERMKVPDEIRKMSSDKADLDAILDALRT